MLVALKIKLNKPALIFLLVLLNLIFLVSYLSLSVNLNNLHLTNNSFNNNLSNNPNSYPEVKELNNYSKTTKSFKFYSDYLTKVAINKGALYAFQLLKFASLPAGIDTHLLGHVVGDQLFKQMGVEGIKYCTQDFRNACSHSIVINIFLQKGEKAIPEIQKACHSAPGGIGAYTMCIHGLGHGILAYVNYDFQRTETLCKKFGTKEYNNREYIECMGGAVMEIISGGGHSHDIWQIQHNKYLSLSDPLSLCRQSFFDDETRGICYIYITPYLFEAAGMDIGNPNPKYYPKAFSYCNQIQDSVNKDICFAGFGKEFIGIANNKDIRNMGSLTFAQVNLVYQWCLMAENKNGVGACIQSADESLFWGGENSPDASFRLCETVASDYQDRCFGSLASSISYFIKNPNDKKALCSRLPEKYQPNCINL
jgi:hypothetical protein